MLAAERLELNRRLPPTSSASIRLAGRGLTADLLRRHQRRGRAFGCDSGCDVGGFPPTGTPLVFASQGGGLTADQRRRCRNLGPVSGGDSRRDIGGFPLTSAPEGVACHLRMTTHSGLIDSDGRL